MRQDKALKCQNCSQEFYRQKNLQQPKFCLICRSVYKKAKKDNFRGKTKQGSS